MSVLMPSTSELFKTSDIRSPCAPWAWVWRLEDSADKAWSIVSWVDSSLSREFSMSSRSSEAVMPFSLW